jgi:parallel beta-helix repeat protein
MNDITDNTQTGVSLVRYSDNNTVSQNNISQNGVGFYIEYSSQNTMWGNNVAGNDLQVYMYTASVNTWNGIYGAGGNYWSDHFSWDIFSGLFQNETGSDGIGDAPYVIDENNVDFYPHVPYRLPADVNNDGYVGIDDIFLIASNFGKEKGQPGWDPLYDIDSDYCVNVTDIFFAARHFGLSSDGPVLL